MKIGQFVMVFMIININFQFNKALANEFFLEDAERFAVIYSNSLSIDEKQIKNNYLDLGSKGVQIFTPNRIQNEKNLTQALMEQPEIYKKALNVCLPAAREVSDDAKGVLNDVKMFLNQKEAAPVYVLFGAGNSGGTASHEGLVLGLEVLCQFANNKQEAKEVILSFVAHELVHVFQNRLDMNHSKDFTLLSQSLNEGMADFVENRILGKISASEIERQDFGLRNESMIWSEFKKVMHGTELQPWMYGDGKQDRPKDLGYWIGKRIVESYYEKALDKDKAIKELLYLKDPNFILETSGYNPK